MIIHILPDVTALYLLLFARIGALVMLMPGIGETTVPTRVRLAMALLITLVFYPVLSERLPQGLSQDMNRLLFVMIWEIMIGVGIGLIARTLMSVVQAAGATISTNIGLSFAQSVDPTMGQQGAIFSSFLSVVGVAVIFSTNLHHLAIAGIVDSYRLFPPGESFPIDDFRVAAVMTMSGAFRVGIEIGSPFIVFALVFNLGLGVLQRLMPQFQVYFLAAPLTILVGLAITAVLIGTVMRLYQSFVETGLMRFVVP